MYHNKARRKLGRTHTHRIATLRALSTALFQRERIRTTLMKAKELRPFAEKLITKSKRDTLHARRMVGRHIHDRAVARKLFSELSSRYTDRSGGYMRILKLGRRQGDGAEMALVELIGSEPVFEKEKDKDKAAKKKGLTSRLMGGRGKGEPEAETKTEEGSSGAKAESAAEPTPAKKTTRTKKATAAKKPAKAASPKKPKAKPAAKKKAAPAKGGKKK